jgi:hypothetical protein
VIFSSKLPSLDHPSTFVSSNAMVKSITRGVVGGGLLITFEASARGVVGAVSVFVDFIGVFVLFDAGFVVFRGERGIVGEAWC